MKRKLVLIKTLPIRPKPPHMLRGKELPKRVINGAAIIAQHPQAKHIVELLREGSSCAAIARFMVQQGYVSQTERTFTDYLIQFRQMHTELLADNPTVSLDDIVNANKPPIHVEQELHRMYRIQKVRLAVGVQNELTSQRLTKDGHRDMSVAHDFLQTIAKMEGKINNPNSEAQRWQQYSPEVREDLMAIKRDEESCTRMRELTMTFIKNFQPKDENNHFPEGEGPN